MADSTKRPSWDELSTELGRLSLVSATQRINELATHYPEYAAQLRLLCRELGIVPPAAIEPLSSDALPGDTAPTRVYSSIERDANQAETTDSAPSFDVGDRVRYIGDYELLGEIARGGMGVVYKARQMTLNRVVALKMIRSGQLARTDEVHRFKAEATAAGILDHPGIVPIYEVGEFQGNQFYSMAFVDGVTLADRLKQGPLPCRIAAGYLKKVAEAISYAHSKGVIHRDIKPANVLIDCNDQPKVTDFGLAKQLQYDSTLTTSGQVLGTPSYMSPEQAAGRSKQISERSDVYSLGATLYCLLVGRPPFLAASLSEMIRQVLEETPVPIRRLNQEVPRDLETICDKCMRKDALGRYATAKQLVDDLDRFLSGRPIAARPIGRWERCVMWVRRNPLAAALGTVSLVASLAVVGVGVSLAYQFELSEAERVVRAARDEARKQRDKVSVQRDAANEAKAEVARHRYISDVAMAARAWREGDLGRVSYSLERQIPIDQAPDLRGFEWHYLRKLEQGEGARFSSRVGWLTANGRHLIVLNESTVEVRDASTHELLRSIVMPEVYPEPSISSDGKRLIGPVSYQGAAVWDLESGNEVGRFQADDLTLSVIVLSADGNLAATCGQGNDHTFRLWEVESGKELHRWPIRSYATMVAFSPDQQLIAFVSSGYSVQVYRIEDFEMVYEIPRQESLLSQVGFDPSGQHLLLATGDDQITLFNSSDGTPAFPPAISHGLHGTCFAFGGEGKRLVTGSTRDRAIRLWNWETGELLNERRGHAEQIGSVSLHPDGTTALSSTWHSVTRVWKFSGKQDRDELSIGVDQIWSLKFSPNPQSPLLALIDQDRALQLWDGQSLRALTPAGQWIRSFHFAPDGQTILVLNDRGEARFWDVKSGQPLHELDLPAGLIGDAAISASGKYVATACFDKEIRVWDAKTGELRHQFLGPTANDGMTQVYFPGADDAFITAQAFEGFQRIRIGETLTVEPLPAEWMTYALEFSPDGKQVAKIGPGPDAVTIWSFPDFKQIVELRGHRGSINAVHFSPNGRRLATSSQDRTLRLWDLETGQEVLKLDCNSIRDFAFHPSGNQILTVDQQLLLIWDSQASDVN